MNKRSPTTKTYLAPDTSKAEVEGVVGICALGRKNAPLLIQTTASSRDSMLPSRCLYFSGTPTFHLASGISMWMLPCLHFLQESMF